MDVRPIPLSDTDRIYRELQRELERQTWDGLAARPLNPNLIQTSSRSTSFIAPEADPAPTIAELSRAMEAVASGPCGMAMNGRLMREVEYALAKRPGAVIGPVETMLGMPIAEDPDLPDGVAYLFHDRDLWRAYLQHLADRRDAQRAVKEAKTILAQAEARDRQRRANAPFRFEAYVERGLIVEARFNATARDQ